MTRQKELFAIFAIELPTFLAALHMECATLRSAICPKSVSFGDVKTLVTPMQMLPRLSGLGSISANSLNVHGVLSSSAAAEIPCLKHWSPIKIQRFTQFDGSDTFRPAVSSP